MDLITQTFVTCFSYQRKTFVRSSIVKHDSQLVLDRLKEREGQGSSLLPSPREVYFRRAPSRNCSLSLDLLGVYPIFLQHLAKPIYRFHRASVSAEFMVIFNVFHRWSIDEEDEETRRRRGMGKEKDPRFSSRE